MRGHRKQGICEQAIPHYTWTDWYYHDDGDGDDCDSGGVGGDGDDNEGGGCDDVFTMHQSLFQALYMYEFYNILTTLVCW